MALTNMKVFNQYLMDATAETLGQQRVSSSACQGLRASESTLAGYPGLMNHSK